MTRFVTFYSWKGGVGRTMALANVAVQLARRGRRVLMVDFDLEAPGLNRYFVKAEKDGENLLRPVPAANNTGLLGLLSNVTSGTKLDSADWQSRLIKIDIRHPATNGAASQPSSSVTLHLLPSGHGQDGYPSLLSAFSWDRFYQESGGDEWLEELRNQWERDYDYVLIDSRTGLTDTGGVCTVHFPDWMVLCFTANDQSFEGGLSIVEAVHEARRKYHRDRGVLTVIPLLSRWSGEAEVDLAEHWMRRFDRELEPLVDSWLPQRFSPRSFVELIRVPQVARFSFGEPLPVLTHATNDPSLPGFYLDRLTSLLDSDLAIESLVPIEDLEERGVIQRDPLAELSSYVSGSLTSLRKELELESGPFAYGALTFGTMTKRIVQTSRKLAQQGSQAAPTTILAMGLIDELEELDADFFTGTEAMDEARAVQRLRQATKAVEDLQQRWQLLSRR